MESEANDGLGIPDSIDSETLHTRASGLGLKAYGDFSF